MNRTLEVRVRWRGCGNVCNPFLIFVCVQDFAYHGLAAFFYLSAAVILANVTLRFGSLGITKTYQIDIAAVVSTEVSLYIGLPFLV